MKYKILEWEGQKAQIVERGQKFLLIPNEKLTDELKNFNELEFKEIDDSNGGILIYSKNFSVIKTLGQFINMENMPLYDSMKLLKNSFNEKSFDYLKFRGDLAELMFIEKNGGQKIFDGASADINLDGEMIEIKSFSPQKESIIISVQQLQEDTLKFAVKINIANEGLSMKQLVDAVKGNVPFKEYLVKSYASSPFWEVKYFISEPIDITTKLPKIDFPKSVLKGDLEISIK